MDHGRRYLPPSTSGEETNKNVEISAECRRNWNKKVGLARFLSELLYPSLYLFVLYCRIISSFALGHVIQLFQLLIERVVL